ncbi:hypothetical protein KP509_12G028000 [Ceratopteris richardii]|uniref:Uncharacterized protein n=1 Tax=Ceratopteris richardii TaxID=49495 RepID=A0A8T2TN23_CERRI|nr:hypothetical protein KP509_12G028000 [Ceratopteris richardii]
MPSSNKRKHHGLAGKTSDIDAHAIASQRSGQDPCMNGELLNRIHMANGKENLLSELTTVSRASCNSETPSHSDPLARISDNGVASKISYLSEATDRYVYANGGLPEGVTMVKRTSDNKPLCPGSVCAHSDHSQQGYTAAIVNLKQLNKQLLEQVCALRSEESLLREKLKSLQLQLDQSNTRVNVLLGEKASSENQKVAVQFDLRANTEEVSSLCLTKDGLVEKREAIVDINHALERDHLKSELQVQEGKEKLNMSIDTLESATQRIQFLEGEIEHLHLEKKKFNEDIMSLQAQNSNLHYAMKELEMEKERLENDLRGLQDSYVAVEDQATQTNTIQGPLESHLVNGFCQEDSLHMQLEGAWKQVHNLELQQEASIAERIDLEKQIKHLESALVSAQEECENSLCMLELEREENMSLRDTVEKTDRTTEILQNGYDIMATTATQMEVSADFSQQQITSLEAKVDCLLQEREVMERTKASLKDKLEHLKNCSDEAFVSSRKEINILKEKVCKLEEALASASMATLEESKCAEHLDSELRELTVSLNQRKRLADVSVPLAIVSTGSLMVLGVLFLCGRR